MAILTGKPSSISANTTSSTITLNTVDLISLLDTVTSDTYWKDITRIKSVLFVYKNNNRQKVNLKFTMPSTSSTISINENSRNGALTCSKIVLTGKANDTLTVNRASFATASEFDLTVIDGYVDPGLSGPQAISWIDPITSNSSLTYSAEIDGGLVKLNPTGISYPSPAYDLILRSSQELNNPEGYIEIDAIFYSTGNINDPNNAYGSSYAIGLNSGIRNSSGDYVNTNFVILSESGLMSPSGPSNAAIYVDGVLNTTIPMMYGPQTPSSSGMGGPPGPGSTTPYSFTNKLRIQLKNGNVEFFVNNVKFTTVVGALASISYPLFAEASLKYAYYNSGMGGSQGSGFPSSRISSTLSTPGTIVRTVDSVSLDSYASPTTIFDPLAGTTIGTCSYIAGYGIRFAKGFINPQTPDSNGAAFKIVNVGSNLSGGNTSGSTNFITPLVEGNPYTVRFHVTECNSINPSASVKIFMDYYGKTDQVSIPITTFASSVGSYVDVAYTPAVYRSISMGPSGPQTTYLIDGLFIYSENTDDMTNVRFSKIELIEA